MSVKLFKGDCLELMKQIEDESIDMILTDPPYGIDLKPQRASSNWKNTKVINDDNLDWLPCFVKESYRILRKDSVAFFFASWQTIDKVKSKIENYFEVKNVIVWDKDWFGLGNNFRPNYELIILATKGKYKTKSNNLSNILKFRRVAPSKLLHSCEKPVALLELLIEESVEEKSIVIDPFMGSGSTGVACVNTNRNFIGMELDEEYFKIAKERIEKADR